jgi:hypothetical protein
MTIDDPALSALSLRQEELVLCGQAQAINIFPVRDHDFPRGGEEFAAVDTIFDQTNRALARGEYGGPTAWNFASTIVAPRIHLAPPALGRRPSRITFQLGVILMLLIAVSNNYNLF